MNPPIHTAAGAHLPPGLTMGVATPAGLSAETLEAVKRHVAALDRWRPCMSYDGSYFGEPGGLVKREVRALSYLLDPLPKPPAVVLDGAAMSTAQLIAGAAETDQIELAYWEMDARIKGYGEWKGRPQSERDAFKAVVRKLLAG